MSHSSQQLLKVFSGPHTGAEVLLDDGDYVIGRDEAVDIILNDRLIAPRHLQLTVADGKVTCLPLDGSGLLIDGQSSQGGPLDAFVYFTLGSTHLAVGPADADWPLRHFPEFQLGGSPVVEQERIAESVAEQTMAETDAEPEAAHRHPSRMWIPAVAALLLVGLLGTLFFTGADAAPTETGAPVDEQIAAILEEAGVPAGMVRVDETDRGWNVTGYVPTKDMRRDVSAKLRELAESIFTRLRDHETLVAATKSTLKRRGLSFEVTAGQPGEIIVAGKTTDLATWTQARDRLPRDVPGIATLTDQVSRPARATKPSTGPVKLATAEPPKSIDPVIAAVTKALTPKQPGEPVAVAETAIEQMQQTDLASLTTDDTITIPYRSIRIGGTKSITLMDGQRLFEGAQLPNGYVVSSIAYDRIVVANGDDVKVHILEDN